MNIRFVVAIAMAVASLSACSSDPQTTTSMSSACVPMTTQGARYDNNVDPNCHKPTANPVAAVWQAMTGRPSAASASAPATRPSS
jgi:hypothetical protein